MTLEQRQRCTARRGRWILPASFTIKIVAVCARCICATGLFDFVFQQEVQHPSNRWVKSAQGGSFLTCKSWRSTLTSTHLSRDDQYQTQAPKHNDASVRRIAKQLERSVSTISRKTSHTDLFAPAHVARAGLRVLTVPPARTPAALLPRRLQAFLRQCR